MHSSTIAKAPPVYRPSGKVSWHAPLTLLFVGIPGAVTLGWLYALWSHYSPAAFISMLGLALFSVFVGAWSWFVLRKGHSRSRRFNVVAGGFLGFVALWVQWVLWIRMGFDQGPKMAIVFATSSPLGWVGFLGLLSERLTQLEPNRFLVHWLPLLWAAEAALLLWLPASIARMAADEPYSEIARAWSVKDVEGELWWDAGSSSELRARLEHEGVNFLLSLPRAVEVSATVASQWWTVSIAGSKVAADPVARWLDVGVVVQTRDEKGKVKSERSLVVSEWIVSEAEYDELAEHLRGKAVQAPISEDDNAPYPLRPTPPELADAVEALQREAFVRASQLAAPHRDSSNSAVRADALRICALCRAREEAWGEAFGDYLALFELESTAMNALQLATTSVMCGELARGEAWFEKACQINADGRSIPWPKLHTNFLSALEQKGEFSAGLPYVERLRDMFQGMTTTDDHVVFMHGFPFLSVFLERSLPYLRASKAEAEVVAWYESMRDHLDMGGQAKLDQWLATMPRAGM